jgi:hypothetical protein
LDLWKQQSERVLTYNGLLSFIIHPDYTTSRRAQDLYRRLLAYLAELRENRGVWLALPGEADTWWRQRSRMRLDRVDGGWRITGEGSERARLGMACRDGDTVCYRTC